MDSGEEALTQGQMCCFPQASSLGAVHLLSTHHWPEQGLPCRPQASQHLVPECQLGQDPEQRALPADTWEGQGLEGKPPEGCNHQTPRLAFTNFICSANLILTAE